MSTVGRATKQRNLDIALVDCAAPQTSVYYCLICGPCMQEHYPTGDVVLHRNIPHPNDVIYDEEERPQ